MKHRRPKQRDLLDMPRPESEARKVLDLLDSIDREAGRKPMTVGEHQAARQGIARFVGAPNGKETGR